MTRQHPRICYCSMDNTFVSQRLRYPDAQGNLAENFLKMRMPETICLDLPVNKYFLIILGHNPSISPVKL